MTVLADLVQQSTATTGTGTVTLGAAVTFQLWRNSGATSGLVALEMFGFSEEYL